MNLAAMADFEATSERESADKAGRCVYDNSGGVQQRSFATGPRGLSYGREEVRWGKGLRREEAYSDGEMGLSFNICYDKCTPPFFKPGGRTWGVEVGGSGSVFDADP